MALNNKEFDIIYQELSRQHLVKEKRKAEVLHAWIVVVANPHHEKIDIAGRKYEIAAYTNENRSYVASWVFSTENKSLPASIIYHELLHVFGVPEFYDPLTQSASSSDIMGLGRSYPIENTYVSRDVKIGLGAIKK